jgi:nicotinamide riboside transporter PnuC
MNLTKTLIILEYGFAAASGIAYTLFASSGNPLVFVVAVVMASLYLRTRWGEFNS